MTQDSILENLTDAQASAVTAGEGPLLIFAGAGSGKTRVLTHRIVYLIEHHNVSPNRILAVTFTNKAAHEMKERVNQQLGGRGQWVWVSTFHAACVRILRRDAERIGYNSNFVIYDDGDQLSLIKFVLRQLNISDELLEPKSIQHRLDQAKSAAVDPVYAPTHLPDHLGEKYCTIVGNYAKELKKNNAFDFGDLIVKAIELLENNESLREYYHERLQHILVDEFQDTNTAQFKLLKLLLGDHNNICVVGDDDQSIYRWRGAKITNILDFENDYKNAQVVILGENFRSTKTILEAAASVIEGNENRKPKDLYTKNPIGEKIALYRAEDEYSEARYVARNVADLVERKGYSYQDIAVFYRTNAQSRLLEEEFSRNAVPYQVIGGMRFYERKEIKDILAYLRVIINPADSISLKRIINVPARGIGTATVEKIDQVALDRDISFLEAAGIAATEKDILPPRSAGMVGAFLDILGKLAKEAEDTGPQQMVQSAIKRSSYEKMLERDKSIESMTRTENLGELVEAVGEFEREFPDGDLAMYLEQVALVSDPDMIDTEGRSLQMMTVHSAKGLEFPAVFVVGMEDGLFPHSRSIDQPKEMAEERRLFYVALTRAQKKVLLSSSEKRRTYGGRPNFTLASRLLDDIPESLLEVESVFTGRSFDPYDQRSRTDNSFGSHGRYRPSPKPKEAPEDSDEPTVDYSYSQVVAPAQLQVGMTVRHAKLGKGQILFLEGEGEYATAIVNFDRAGIKKLRLQYAKLVPV